MIHVASIRPSDLLALAWSSLRRNRLRSLLTIGAISVGVAVMVYLISLGFGLENITLGNVSRSSSLLSITINSGSEKLQPLTPDRVEKISSYPQVQETLPRLEAKGEIALETRRAPVTVVGVDPDYLQITDNTQLSAGRYYRKEDVQVMVVSTGFLKLFGLDEGKVPLILFTLDMDKDDYPNLPRFTDIAVSGVVKSDAVVTYFPRPYLESSLGTFAPYSHMKVTVRRIEDIETVRNTLIANGFRVSTVVDTVDEIKKVFRWIQIVMGVLGLIAVVVATIGMFNTLTISLLERTKEIGIMKALGVKQTDIRRLFMVEALLIGLLGGVFGITLAFFFQQVTLFIFTMLAALVQGVVPQIFINHWYLLFGAILFSLFIAWATGMYPAKRAMKLNPIEAIRYE